VSESRSSGERSRPRPRRTEQPARVGVCVKELGQPPSRLFEYRWAAGGHWSAVQNPRHIITKPKNNPQRHSPWRGPNGPPVNVVGGQDCGVLEYRPLKIVQNR